MCGILQCYRQKLLSRKCKDQKKVKGKEDQRKKKNKETKAERKSEKRALKEAKQAEKGEAQFQPIEKF